MTKKHLNLNRTFEHEKQEKDRPQTLRDHILKNGYKGMFTHLNK